METNYFKDLNEISVTDKVEKKNGLSYLSWAWAWSELKKKFPDAQYKVERFGEDNAPYLYDDNLGYMVFTSVTVNGLTHEMWLPVMDGANKAMKKELYTYDTKYKKDIPVQPATMFDINKTIMRCLVKNIGMHGLGLYIYAGEDLPEDYVDPVKQKQQYINEVNQRMQDLVRKHQSKEKVYGLLKLSSEQFLNLYSNEPHKLIELIDKYAK